MKAIFGLPYLKVKALILILAVLMMCYFVVLNLGEISGSLSKSFSILSLTLSMACSRINVDALEIADKHSVCSNTMTNKTVEKVDNATGSEDRYRPLTEMDYARLTSDCATFLQSRKYITFTLNNEDRDFPIAYSILVHYKIEMFERLLRTIYAPQNVYCVHVDRKSPKTFHLAVSSIASCFQNVFIASRIEQVTYGSWSRVQADLNCMSDLVMSATPWKYLINLCGQDLPIKTNREIIEKLLSIQNQNIILSYPPSAAKKRRWLYQYEVGREIKKSARLKKKPRNITMFVGNTYIAVTRAFVNYVLSNFEIQQFFKWSKDTYSPDEHVWATIHNIRGVPGSKWSNGKTHILQDPVISHLIKWRFLQDVGENRETCAGIYRHNICVYGTGDLHWILRHPNHLFANKFDSAMDNTAVRCIEEYLRQKVIKEINFSTCKLEETIENATDNNVVDTTE
ncbi:beta-1,3-galactosyl-O-glycosyl-glycoprotein beta-1,6-N-acetylglucosaminyltransferase 3-like [Scyliorhinus canicula]|uniref:beta-1,3-galactosyl-O-glycosyl-glycoprotein beta-1,6-N-acetylglucosaminyltransferase 3-like n=1 Tax=Scyliorhinus canicula TaxID=7830 RepID=UPI0018F4F356|nr:beta-1,3-galactosyl-O-glycosyl-glycoprotein beta-1,6-N-acetylglucosaminyltransferase 3-like [Scyliorhinus canicula]XP_038656848.1 beta-1,3-galactosyl-O-glycosyl-glycoprotein beta-1,6-N-acetylglucosaminyltransferase 3-like [Scyliorhinus canicula]XP_038656849.1 beta-1,3-galactosyl-O-glycosyl-glycoprotein beta-1,6-N-acetylglucosaminyltransferase 3-like [Scyliorhinus canicula]XP_038656850.1 beta-1,3-galactosyl-O-glycosyl-glycoprotein beta-1,6-N-acetylglucosaminyltransferase 3-like [Scyliorhinus c